MLATSPGYPPSPSPGASPYPSWEHTTTCQESLVLAQCLLLVLSLLSLLPCARVLFFAHSFCWGGLYAVLLAQGQTPKVSAAVVYHGSLLTAADVEAVTAPINFQQSDPALDRQLGPELYKQVRPVLWDVVAVTGLATRVRILAVHCCVLPNCDSYSICSKPCMAVRSFLAIDHVSLASACRLLAVAQLDCKVATVGLSVTAGGMQSDHHQLCSTPLHVSCTAECTVSTPLHSAPRCHTGASQPPVRNCGVKCTKTHFPLFHCATG